jgi:hypothetical protein
VVVIKTRRVRLRTTAGGAESMQGIDLAELEARLVERFRVGGGNEQSLNAVGQFSHAVPFGNHGVKANGLGWERCTDQFAVHGVENCADVGHLPFQDRRGLQTIQPRHCQIQQD